MLSPETLGVVGLLVMLGGLFLGIHIGIVLGVIGFAGYVALLGFSKAVSMMVTTAYYTVSDYNFIALPMFVMMGEFAFQGGIGSLLYAAASKWLGHLHAGLAMATCAANALFATMSGDSLSATATFGKIAIPEMMRYKYDKLLACGVVAGAGGLAVLIPPSGPMILYCIFTEVSLGKLMMAGFLPGIMSALIYMTYLNWRVRLKPSLAPRSLEIPSWRERFSSIRWLIPIFVVVIVMLGGIYTGVFSPVEGGAIGACTVFILNLLRRKFSLTMFITSLKNVVGTTAMIFLVVIGAMMFSKFLMISNLTGTLKTFIEGLHVSPMIVLFIILFIYIILGCILPVVAMLAISLPIFFPILSGLGFDGIWFGIMIILEVEIAALTPPVGLNVYVLKAVVGDLLSTGGIFRSILPFFILDLIILAILIAFPMISLWLPSMMYK